MGIHFANSNNSKWTWAWLRVDIKGPSGEGGFGLGKGQAGYGLCHSCRLCPTGMTSPSEEVIKEDF